MSALQSYLNGQWVKGDGEGAPLFNPATGEVIATASTVGLSRGDALAHARAEGGPALRALSFAQRGERLLALSQAIYRQRDELLELSRLNTGTTIKDGKFDVDGATATLAAYGEWGKQLGDGTFLMDGEGEQIGRSPRFHGQHIAVPRRGVAIHINAFNFPAWGMAEKLACSFLAGMPTLSKPATATALPAERMARIMVEADLLPPGSFSFLCGSAGDLLDHVTGQDVIAFTGSADTARMIRGHERVLAQSTTVNVEADSLNAMVVGPDVEVGSATWNLFLRELTTEITQKTGQKCTATRRVFLPEHLIEGAIEGLRERLADYPCGDPISTEVRVGPLAVPSQYADVRAGLVALADSCETVLGELPAEDAGTCATVEPMVFLQREPRAATLVHEREVFGPAVTLMPYTGDATEAGELVALGSGCLVAAIYSDDLAFTRELLLELAPWNGRVLLGSKGIAEHSTGPGVVMPGLVHGGPGRAGGGLELGGLRGLRLYMQTCAVQGARPVIEKLLKA